MCSRRKKYNEVAKSIIICVLFIDYNFATIQFILRKMEFYIRATLDIPAIDRSTIFLDILI